MHCGLVANGWAFGIPLSIFKGRAQSRVATLSYFFATLFHNLHTIFAQLMVFGDLTAVESGAGHSGDLYIGSCYIKETKKGSSMMARGEAKTIGLQ